MEPITTPIIRRRVNIDFESAKTPGWHPSRRELEDFLNAISFVFPPGEKFFIESVQNYQDRITDPVLKDQVKRFIYQEAMHTKEHNRANRVLDQSYPYGNDIEKFTGTILSLTQRFTPKAIRLAVTCALEHFTAILAELLLRNQEQFIAESDPAFAALWLWHAVEEAEHKAVCFDVYRQVVGKGPLSYIVRVGAMVSSTLFFLLTLVCRGQADQQAGKRTAGHRRDRTIDAGCGEQATPVASSEGTALFAVVSRLLPALIPSLGSQQRPSDQ